MISDTDVVIVGAGHNGLVCAAYLARAGLRVKIFERRHMVGGCAVTEEFHPGFRNSVCAYTVSLLNRKIVDDLGLYQRGLEIILRPLANFLPLPDGGYFKGHADPDRMKAEIARFSERDAANWDDYQKTLSRLADLLKAFVLETPPNAGGGLVDLWRLWKTGRRFQGLDMETQRDFADIMTMSAEDFLCRWFESEPVKALYAFDAVVGNFASPKHPGTAYVLLHHCFGDLMGEAGGWGHAVGGMGAIGDALAGAAEDAGVEIELGVAVERIVTTGKRVQGVRLADGREVTARVVSVNAHPKLLSDQLLETGAAPPEFHARMSHYRSASATFRMNVALRELPDFKCLPGREVAEHHTSGIIIGSSIAEMEQAYRDAMDFGWSRQPIVEMLIPSTIDDSLAPPGQHVASLFCQHFNPDLGGSRSWREWRDQAAETIIDRVSDYAPNFRTAILGRQILSPADLEEQFGLVGGDIFHGALSLNQLFSLRPMLGHADYRMPVKGLYLCGAGAHPGGGVTGAPGHNAAREILRDL